MKKLSKGFSKKLLSETLANIQQIKGGVSVTTKGKKSTILCYNPPTKG